MRVAFRIEVNSLKGAAQGVPSLLRLFDEYKVQGSFLLSLGADHSSSLFNGLLPASWQNHLPAQEIAQKERDNLRAIKAAGHEMGISAYTPSAWQSGVAYQPGEWVKDEVTRAVDAFNHLMGEQPLFYGASNWQINSELLSLEEEVGFHFASDVRGRSVFLPELQGVSGSCPQIPTTLPTLTELSVQDGITQEKLHEYLFAESQRVLPNGEVFSLNADLEGVELLEVFERILVVWKGSQWDFKTLSELVKDGRDKGLPVHQIGWGEVPGRNGYLAMQSLEIKR